MLRIYKTTPPKEYILWYNNRIPKPSMWDHLNSSDKKVLEEGDFDYSKNRLRNYLHKEQSGICSYCNKRIKNDHSSKIEHFLPKGIYINETFNYYNLILSCDGNAERESDKKYHCDKLKEDNEIRINPTKQKYLNEIIYDEFGNIFSEHVECIRAITILGLECKSLINRRKTIINGIVFDLNGNYYESEYYRKQFIKTIYKPLEFNLQIQIVLLNLLNSNDRLICLGVLGLTNAYKKFIQLIKITAKFKYYNYKMKQ